MTGELGQTRDPKLLVPGDPASIREAARGWPSRAHRHEHASLALGRLNVADAWDGESAGAFGERLTEYSKAWQLAADGYRTGWKALDAYADDLTAAQKLASRAVELWDRAEDLTAAGDTEFAHRVETERRKAADTGASFVRPEYPGDRGSALRAEAISILESARTDADDAADRAAALLEEQEDVWAGLLRIGLVAGTLMALQAEELLRQLVNANASMGQALLDHPELIGEILGGALMIIGGAGGEVGGGALTATGVGAVGGVPAIAGSTALIGGGIALAGAGATQAIGFAATTSRVEVWEARGPDRGDGRATDGTWAPKDGGGNPNYASKELEAKALDDLEDEWGTIIRDDIYVRVEGASTKRAYDGLVKEADGNYTAFEIKSGTSRDPKQEAFDALVSPENPAVGKLNGEEINITRVVYKYVDGVPVP